MSTPIAERISPRLTGARFARLCRTLGLLVLLAGSLASGSTYATDYFLRTDGDDSKCTGRSNAAYPGSGTGAPCAWKSIAKCASTLVGGDSCFIQPGVYYTSANVEESTSGSYQNDAASGCSCVKGSTTITCGSGASTFSPKDYVQCDTGFGFFYTEVASVSGNTITLVEPYPGPNATGDTADRLRPIRYVGANGTVPVSDPTTVVITPFTGAGVPTFTQNTTYPHVYQYTTTGKSSPWDAPTAIRQAGATNQTFAQAVSSWDLYDAGDSPSGKNGLDSYYRFPNSSTCPCNRATVLESVADVPGSWGIDGTTVYVHTYDSNSPSGYKMEATKNPTSMSVSVFSVTGDNVLLEGLTFEGVAEQDPESGSPGRALMLGNGAETRIRLRNVRVHGSFRWVNGTNAMDVLFDNVLITAGMGSTDTHTNMTGVKFYNMKIRGGHGNGWTADALSGASVYDPVVLDRFYLFRTRDDLSSSDGCAVGTNTWDCSVKPGRQLQPYRGSHGLYLGSAAANREIRNILIQNCIIENTLDGIGMFASNDDRNVKIRNCTFAGSDYLAIGSTADRGTNAQIYNNLFLRDAAATSSTRAIAIYTNVSQSQPISDYNVWYVNDARGLNVPTESPFWRDQDVGSNYYMPSLATGYSREVHSQIVCDAGCSSGVIRVTNKSNPWGDFIDTSFAGGTNYTPRTGAVVINAGYNAECPEEDYFGNPRNDGNCDVGAVEYQGNAPDTIPPVAVTNLEAMPSGNAIALSWQNSVSSDNAGTLLRVRMDRAPSDPSDGAEVCRQAGPPSSAGSCEHSGVEVGRTYYYSAYSYDRAGNYGSGVSTSAVADAADTQPPGTVPAPRRTDQKTGGG
jgi:hypothetical protein